MKLIVVALSLVMSLVSAVRADDAYRIGPGDKLEVSIWRNDQLSRSVIVRPDGKISLPLVNDVQAAGSTPMELRAELAKRFDEFVPSAEVSVMVSDVRSFSVSVIGAVNKPGHLELHGPTTVLDALASSGGLTEFASRKNIAVLRTDRSGKRRIPFNYNAALDSDVKGDTNFQLQAGDVVVVP